MTPPALAALFQQAVDTDWIGKFALGPYWRTAPQQERKPYLDTFRNYLTDIYISKFHADDAEQIKDIKLLSIAPQADDRLYVKSLIERKGDGKTAGEDTQVDYILKQSPHECQVHDIRVAGVSLLVTLRSEFSEVASDSGVKGVISQMQKRLAAD
ncbi:MAG: ABC transporter substrate-binding protein [Alphaproteobacteria bacterium]|nr:ABC transporter substrate-binding protein [Alphaproteobacteria bacterium]